MGAIMVPYQRFHWFDKYSLGAPTELDTEIQQWTRQTVRVPWWGLRWPTSKAPQMVVLPSSLSSLSPSSIRDVPMRISKSPSLERGFTNQKNKCIEPQACTSSWDLFFSFSPRDLIPSRHLNILSTYTQIYYLKLWAVFQTPDSVSGHLLDISMCML